MDDISRELASGTFSRRRAIKLTAGALLGSALIPLFSSSPAEARRRNPCRGKEPICEAAVPENCKGNPNCFCARTVEGGKRGVDILGDTCPATAECDSSEDCPGDEVCICGPGMRICVSKCG